MCCLVEPGPTTGVPMAGMPVGRAWDSTTLLPTVGVMTPMNGCDVFTVGAVLGPLSPCVVGALELENPCVVGVLEPEEPGEPVGVLEPEKPGAAVGALEPEKPGSVIEPIKLCVVGLLEPEEPDASAEPLEPEKPGAAVEPVKLCVE